MAVGIVCAFWARDAPSALVFPLQLVCLLVGAGGMAEALRRAISEIGVLWHVLFVKARRAHEQMEALGNIYKRELLDAQRALGGRAPGAGARAAAEGDGAGL